MIKIQRGIIRILRKCKYIVWFTLKYGKKVIKALIKEAFGKVLNIRKPRILQFPVTYRCNFDCIMCGMKNLRGEKEISLDEYKKLFESDLFDRVTSVGINGGEPFLRNDLIEIVQLLIAQMPRLDGIAIISNGFFTDIILKKMERIKTLCEQHQVRVTLSISVDAISEQQDFHRGCCGAWERAQETLQKIHKKRKIYCDEVGIICTITKKNVYNLFQIDAWAKKNHYNISYNMATINKRIQNEEKFHDFSILTDEHAKMCAREFFFSKFLETWEEKYFGLFYYLCEEKRIAPCEFKEKGVTITPNGELSFCATFSDEVGSAVETDAHDVYKKNLGYRRVMCKGHCKKCSHYMYSLSGKGYLELIKMLMREYTRPVCI